MDDAHRIERTFRFRAISLTFCTITELRANCAVVEAVSVLHSIQGKRGSVEK
jgi:hypothetical protein